MERDFYTVAEVATKLEVGLETPYEAVDAGDTHSVRARRCIRIPRAAFDLLIAEGVPKKP